MTRTQVLLEESQYRWLVVQAHRQHKSLSQVLRELLDAQRAKFIGKRHDDPLFRLIGMGPDRARDVAEQHDRYLYKIPRLDRRGILVRLQRKNRSHSPTG